MAETRVVKAPPAGSKQSVYLQPNEQVQLGFDPKDSRVDILGSDIIFTFKDGSQLIMTNLAVTLYSENPPILNYGEEDVDPDKLLSSIGVVQSVSGRDAALLTSMQVDKNNTSEVDQEVQEQQKVVYKMRDNPPIVINPPPTLDSSTSNLSQSAKFQERFTKTLDKAMEAPDRNVSDNTNVGQYTLPPVDANPPRIQALAPINGSGIELGAPLVFAARLLQVGPSVTTSGSDVLYQGGTGSSSALIDPSALTQVQSEFIDLTRITSAVTIFGDNSSLVNANLLTRSVQIQPALPVQYLLTALTIEGLPSGITLQGFTPNGSGHYVFNNNNLPSGTGVQNFTLVYDPTQFTGPATDIDGDSIASEFASFTLTIRTTMVAPDLSNIINDVHTVPVVVKDTTQSDNAYNGQTNGWVLDVKPNANIILTGDGGVTVHAGNLGDRIASGTGNDTIFGGTGDDIVTTSSGNDVIDPGQGNNIIDGGDNSDTISYSTRNDNVSIDLGGAQDSLGQITATVGATQQDKIKNVENVTSGTGNDTIYGNDLANTLNGGNGIDTLMGRGGNDTIIGGGGNDTVLYTYSTVGVTVDLQAGTASGVVTDSDTISGVENIVGSDFADTLLGDGQNNVIEGGLGDDLLNGRTGNDTLDGGAGINTASFANQTSGVSLTLQNAGDSTATAGADSITIRNVRNLIGSSLNDSLTGNNADNTIFGSGGNDTLSGGTGTDTLSYDTLSTAVTANLGTGSVTKTSGTDSFSNFDSFVGTAQGDTVLGGALINVIDGADGTDTLSYQNIGTSVTVNIDTGTTTGALTQTFSNIENIRGGTANDILTGDANDNVISGDGGDDTLNANGGNDTLDGGGGTDTATFASYADPINVNLGNTALEVVDDDGDTVSLVSIETLVATAGADTFNSGATSRTISLDGGAGTDLMSFATETAAVTANLSGTATGAFGTYTFVGNSIENLTGGSGNDTLAGTSGNNVINGGSGNDSINANGGSDTVDGGIGTDTLTYASYGAAVNVNLQTLQVTDASAGVVTFQNIETIVGTGSDDTFRSGFAIVNYTLDAGAGTDTLDFSQLQSAIIANLGSSTAATNGGAFSYTVSNFENLTGSNGDDQLTGNTGNNIINAGNGNDHFTFSTGTDTLDGGSGTDYYNFLSQNGSAATINLGAADITITDGASQNTTLRNIEWVGGTNNNDTFNSGSTSRSVTIFGGSGTDTISFSTETTAVVANLSSNATGAFGTYSFWDGRSIENLIGGSGNDTLTGSITDQNGIGNNVISGGGGDDLINGNGGNDTIAGDGGFDTVTFAAVTANITYVLGATSTANYTGTFSIASATSMTTIERILSGSGNDYFTAGGTGLSFTLDAGTGNDTIDFNSQVAAVTANLNTTLTGAFGTYTIENTSFENIITGSASDAITGTSVSNVIIAGNGSDTINAGGGDDTIEDSLAFGSNSANVINAEGGNDTVGVSVANNTIDGGTGSDTLRYDAFSTFGAYALGRNTTADLTFTLNSGSTGGTVTNGTQTDTFSNFETYVGGTGNDLFIGGSGADVFFGQDGNDTFRGGAGNDTFNGGNGINTIDYSTAAAGVTVNLTAGTTSNDGDGGTDSFSLIQNVIGSSSNDTITDNSNNNVINAGAGDDTIIVSTGNDNIDGSSGNDTLNYSNVTAPISLNLNLSSVSGSGVGTDTYLNIENISLGTGNDTMSATPANLFANTINFNFGAGYDSIVLSGGAVGTTASTLASRISNVEYLDFRNANTAGGNLLFTGDDVFAMAGGTNKMLRLDISTGFGLDVVGGSYTLSTANNMGVITYSFLNGAVQTVASLEVHVT